VESLEWFIIKFLFIVILRLLMLSAYTPAWQ